MIRVSDDFRGVVLFGDARTIGEVESDGMYLYERVLTKHGYQGNRGVAHFTRVSCGGVPVCYILQYPWWCDKAISFTDIVMTECPFVSISTRLIKKQILAYIGMRVAESGCVAKSYLNGLAI